MSCEIVKKAESEGRYGVDPCFMTGRILCVWCQAKVKEQVAAGYRTTNTGTVTVKQGPPPLKPSIQPGQPLFAPTREWLLDAADRIEKADHKWSQGFTAPMLRLTADAMRTVEHPDRIAMAIEHLMLDDYILPSIKLAGFLTIRDALDTALSCFTDNQIAEAISAKEEATSRKRPSQWLPPPDSPSTTPPAPSSSESPSASPPSTGIPSTAGSTTPSPT